MVDRYNGDPKLTLDENGADLTYQGGQPVMDAGIENAALISLHTESGWFGNTFFRKAVQKLGGRYMDEANKALSFDQINRIRNAAQSDLDWMVEEGIADTVFANVTNPIARSINTIIQITPPNVDPTTFVLTKAGLNWQAQKLDPAYKKV